MPSLEESRRQVAEGLDKAADHDAILASLQDEIDRHNAVKDQLKNSVRKSKRSHYEHHSSSQERLMKFRFKSSTEDTRKSRPKHHHRSMSKTDKEERHHCHKKRRKETENYPTPPQESHPPEPSTSTSHPFPREPADPLSPSDDKDAFRASLFDALADDEGVAAYWESVYSQPIHIYPRPEFPNEETAMSEGEYVEYVKLKMWEKKHPEVVFERRQQERERKLAEEEATRRREEFVRRKEQAAWDRSQRRRFRDRGDEDGGDGGYEYVFDAKDWTSDNAPGAKKKPQQKQQEYAAAWSTYLSAWDNLKHELLTERNNTPQDAPAQDKPNSISKRIPWATLPSQPPTKPNIEAFMRHAPASDQKSRLQILKAERVRWHPDKMQQRFGGTVDEGTMKLVTGVFLVVDCMVEEERKREGIA